MQTIPACQPTSKLRQNPRVSIRVSFQRQSNPRRKNDKCEIGLSRYDRI